MTPNIGTIDRTARIVIGLVLIALAISGIIGAWGYIGLVPLATAMVNFCPLYKMLGMSTRKSGTPSAG